MTCIRINYINQSTSTHMSEGGSIIRQPADKAFFKSLNTKAKLEYLCLLGHLAPSSHNTQPWRFLTDETNFDITIYLNRKFILPASDVDGRQATISIGCAAENIMSGALYYGYFGIVEFLTDDKTKIKPSPQSEDLLIPIVKIKFQESDLEAPQNILKAIFERKVTRAEYDPTKQIPDNILESIQKMTDGEETKLHIITDSLRRLSIAEFQSQADAYVINSPKFSKELGEWLLPNNSESYLGMPGIGFGLQDDEAQRLHNGLSGKLPLQPEDGLKFAMGGKVFIEKSPMIGIITTKKDNIESWLKAGGIFEKIFLELTNQGIQVAVHAGITEVSLIKKIFSLTLGTNRYITVLFRAGYVKKEADNKRLFSPRLPLREVLLSDKL
jgi:nitroreductase